MSLFKFSLCCAKIGGVIHKNGYDISLTDVNVNTFKLKFKIQDFDPNVNCSNYSNPNCFAKEPTGAQETDQLFSNNE